MLTRRFILPILLIATAALALAGCGSADSPAPTAGTNSADTTSTTGAGTPPAPVTTPDGTVTTPAQEPTKSTDADGNMQFSGPPPMTIDTGANYQAKVVTNKGTFTISLLPKEGPIAANNFVFLAQHGFYTNVPIHRVIKGFMFQTGDPTGTGSGGPGYSIQDDEVNLPYTRGVVAMANAGPNTGGSQFFVMHQNYDLPPDYSIFGKVTSGLDTVDAIANTPVEDNGQSEVSKPTTPLVVKSITIEKKS